MSDFHNNNGDDEYVEHYEEDQTWRSDLTEAESIDLLRLATNNAESRCTRLELGGKRNFVASGLCRTVFGFVKSTSYLVALALTNLDLSSRGVIEDLTLPRTLTSLWLNHCELQSTHACILADSLVENRCLRELSLSGNLLGANGAVSLAQALSHNRVLKRLDLSANFIGSGATRAVCDALRVNDVLTELNLQFNPFDTDDVTSLTTAIVAHNGVLLSCGWSFAVVPPLGPMRQLEAALVRNRSRRWRELAPQLLELCLVFVQLRRPVLSPYELLAIVDQVELFRLAPHRNKIALIENVFRIRKR